MDWCSAAHGLGFGPVGRIRGVVTWEDATRHKAQACFVGASFSQGTYSVVPFSRRLGDGGMTSGVPLVRVCGDVSFLWRA